MKFTKNKPTIASLKAIFDAAGENRFSGSLTVESIKSIAGNVLVEFSHGWAYEYSPTEQSVKTYPLDGHCPGNILRKAGLSWVTVDRI